ncbi:MAG TPA: hypothetical protein VK456_15790 [Xanthobacteraceae bacterium]|nr:hypothetical protein [Xanthobacteraceae bacterium]
MVTKSTTERAKEKLVHAAKSGADTVRGIAGEAIRAAAVAAAGIALQKTAEALRGTARKAETAAPTAQPSSGPPPASRVKRAKTRTKSKGTAKAAKTKSATKKRGRSLQ